MHDEAPDPKPEGGTPAQGGGETRGGASGGARPASPSPRHDDQYANLVARVEALETAREHLEATDRAAANHYHQLHTSQQLLYKTIDILTKRFEILIERFNARFPAPLPSCTKCGGRLNKEQAEAGVKEHPGCGGSAPR